MNCSNCLRTETVKGENAGGRSLSKDRVSQRASYRRKKKFDGMGVEDLKRLMSLEEKNRRLTSLVSDLSLDKKILQDVFSRIPETCSSSG